MTKHQTIASLLALAVLFSPSTGYSQSDTALDLINNCRLSLSGYENPGHASGLDNQKSAMCIGYVQGFLEGTGFMEGYTKHTSPFCLEDNVTIYQVTKIFVNFADQNPSLMNKASSAVLTLALRQSFPCGK